MSIFFTPEQWNHLQELETGLEVKVEVGVEELVSELEFEGDMANQSLNSRNSGKGKFKCKECGKTYAQDGSLSEHMRFHKGAFSCPVCGRQLSKKSHLNRHMRNIHGVGVDKTTTPSVKERTTSFPWKIKSETNSNGSGPPSLHNVYEDDDTSAGRRPLPKLVKATPEMFESILHRMPQAVTKKEHLTKMKRLETVPFPPHACDICGRRYMHRRSLNDHTKSHTDETKCPYCYKKFSKVANMRAHVIAQHPHADTSIKKID